MKYCMDREIRDSLLEALEGLKAYQLQYAAGREKWLWKQINLSAEYFNKKASIRCDTQSGKTVKYDNPKIGRD